MQTQQFAYPFDPNGTAPSNLVVGERHTITPINGGDFRFLVPKASPYFRNSLIVKHVATNRILTDGVDYQPGHRYDAASNTAPFLSIFGSILIMDNTLEGTFEIQYQTLGGEHTVDESIILAMLANTQIDPRMTKWDVVLETPGVYDPLLHRQHVSDFVGWDDAVVAINRLVDAVIDRMENGSTEDPVARSHIANKSNPHEVRLAQLPDGAHLTSLSQTHVAYLLQQAQAGGVLQFLEIAENITQENELKALPAESFSEVFNTWERIAWRNNNPQDIPAELSTWSFDAANNQLVSTTNSVSMVGFLSPTTVSGDYHFEVELESNDVDDDVIGVFLGKAFIEGKWRNLVAQRTASVNGAGVYLTYDRYGDQSVNLAGSNVDLLEFPNGWLGYKNLGVVKLKVVRTGSVVEVWTTNPGTDYLESCKLTYDLNTLAKLDPFKGPVQLGYIAASQRNARFRTIRRTGSKRPIANLASKKVYEFDGVAYNEVVGKTFGEYLPKSMFYYSKVYRKLYYSEQPGELSIISSAGGGGGNGSPEQPVSNQLTAGDFFVPDNSGGVATYLAPTSPANFATIEWVEGPVSFATNKLVIQNTDKPIMGKSEPLEVTTAGAGGKMIYYDALGYWKVYLNSQAGSVSGGSGGTSNVINKLTVTSPTNEQSGVPANFSLACTAFATTPALADSLSRYEWQLATDTSFNNLLWSGSTTTNAATPVAVIPSGTRVYVRVRAVGASYGAGAWSDLVTFVVAAIAGPTSVSITGTDLASGGKTHQFTITSTAWSGGGTHTASQFQVLTTGGTVVYDSNELAGAIVSHKPFDAGFRPTNLTDYSARVRYKLASGQWTDYTSTALRTGNGAFTTASTSFQTSRWSSWTFNALTSWYTAGGGNDPYGEPAPYHICYADDGIGQGVEWVCDPGNPTANAPAGYNPASMGAPLVSAPYPRTSVTTQMVTSELTQYNTSTNTQKWTEW